ncbi:MAG: hypothetical protein OQK82_02460 [Candidatus Pacearchaeota archaeon]|nr:hypothetical protein [Candidatus Pacearchaeota archaeon]
MSKSTYQILAVLFDLLGKYDATSLMQASEKRGLSKNMRRAILSLADEALLMEEGTHAISRPKSSKAEKVVKRSVGGAYLPPDLPKDIYEKKLYDFLMNSSHLRTRSALIEFVTRLGFLLDFNKKDNRDRVAKQIVSFAMGHEDFRIALHNALANESSQTEGWLKLIRGEM